MSKTKAIDRELMQNHVQQQKIVKLLLLGRSTEPPLPAVMSSVCRVVCCSHTIYNRCKHFARALALSPTLSTG